jgi:hypothetical protein
MTKNNNISASSYKNNNKKICVNGNEKPNKKYYSERYQAIEDAIYENFKPTVSYNGNVIPSYTITKAQKTFISKPNMGGEIDRSDMPKPKSLYFVYFKLNDSFYEKLNEIDPFTDEFHTKSELQKSTFSSENVPPPKPPRNVPQILFELSKLVKEYDKPKVTFETTSLIGANKGFNISFEILTKSP